MPKIDVGEKQTCPQCGAKFYDLTRRPAVCPKCAFSFDPRDEAFRARRVKARAGGYDPVADDDEELPENEEAAAPDDEEGVEAAELEEVVDDAPEGTLIDDEDDTVVAEEDDLGEGFSEADVEVEDAEDDDSVLFLEDDDDEFEEEIGDIGEKDEDL